MYSFCFFSFTRWILVWFQVWLYTTVLVFISENEVFDLSSMYMRPWRDHYVWYVLDRIVHFTENVACTPRRKPRPEPLQSGSIICFSVAFIIVISLKQGTLFWHCLFFRSMAQIITIGRRLAETSTWVLSSRKVFAML